MWLWKARGARSLDQAGEAAGVAEIELVLGALPQWSLGFYKVGQKGRGWGGNCRLLGRWETLVPGGESLAPLCWGGTGADFRLEQAGIVQRGHRAPISCFWDSRRQ